MIPDIAQLGQLGLGGMAIWLFYRLASNHIEHNTQAINELKEVIKELKEFLLNHK